LTGSSSALSGIIYKKLARDRGIAAIKQAIKIEDSRGILSNRVKAIILTLGR
jgi:hypothetical protein